MYYVENTEKIVLFDEDKNKLQNTIAFMPQYAGLEIKETTRPIVDFQFADTDEYKEEQAQKEAARIALLNLTAADVERGLYKAKGIDFEDVLTQIEAMPLAEGHEPVVDIKALKIELKANNFYRGNPYINTIGQLLGLSTGQLDSFFEAGNSEDAEVKANAYKYLTTVTLTINPTPEDSTITINGAEQNTVTVPYGDTVEYSVTHEGYLTQSGSIELTEDTTLEIELVKEVVENEPTDTEPVTENESNAEVEDEDSAGTGD